MADVIAFKPPGTSRQAFIESVISLGAEDGSRMNLPAVLDAARATAWREVHRIASECCEHARCPVEREEFPLIDTVDAGARSDLADAAALVVARDLMLADLMPKGRPSP